MTRIQRSLRIVLQKNSSVFGRAGQRGSAIIESAVVLPVIMLMACGAMDLARVFYAGIVVESAARAGVQVGSFSVAKAGAITEMDGAATSDSSGQGMTGITIASRTFCGCAGSTSEVSCTTATCTGAIPSGYVETTATYTFTPLIQYPGIPSPIVIRSAARFRAQ
jgi:Flp pilus assembly protein TadG